MNGVMRIARDDGDQTVVKHVLRQLLHRPTEPPRERSGCELRHSASTHELGK